VRDNAAVDDLRVCVFTGPVLADKDPLWREHVIPGFRVPLRFWKVVVWSEGGKLRSLAMIAGPAAGPESHAERIGEGEAYADTSAVEDYRHDREEPRAGHGPRLRETTSVMRTSAPANCCRVALAVVAGRCGVSRAWRRSSLRGATEPQCCGTDTGTQGRLRPPRSGPKDQGSTHVASEGQEGTRFVVPAPPQDTKRDAPLTCSRS
jgi:hypothetical protein